MNKAEYRRYIDSSAWRERRMRRLSVAGYRCEFDDGTRCATTFALEVHHLNYERVGCERDDDLKVVCHFHHLVQHVLETGCWAALSAATASRASIERLMA